MTLLRLHVLVLEDFVVAVSRLDGPRSYRTLRADFGVIRSSDRFWSYSDRIQEEHRKQKPTVDFGSFDFNRLEAF